MKVVRSISDLRLGGEVGLVPTMGALHAGHVSLFDAARAENEVVVASLFVNPAQFGEQSDLARYPRDEARDLELAEQAGVDILFAPTVEEMYPTGFATWVDIEETGAEGGARPRHFRGVATVCSSCSTSSAPPVRTSARRTRSRRSSSAGSSAI